MRYLKLFFMAALLLSAPVLAAPSSSKGATPDKLPSPVVAIVDVQRILDESLAAKSVQKQLGAQRAKFQAEIEGEENGLRKAEDELTKSHDKTAEPVYAEREQKLRERFLAVERHVQARRKVLDQAFTDSMNDVRAALLEIVDAVAHEHGSNLVIVKQQALWADKVLDVTDEVLTRLNKKLPQVAINRVPEDNP